MAITTLQDLQQSLQTEAQAANGAITLDATFLDARVTALITSALNAATPSIALTAVIPANITLSADQTMLFVTGAQTPAGDADAFLHLTSMPANVVFELVAGEFNFILQVTPPPTWTLGDSLDELKLLTAPGFLTTTSQSLYFSTFTAPQPLPSFPDAPPAKPSGGPVAAGTTTPMLAKGLNDYAIVGLSGIFELAATLLSISDTLAMWGAIDANLQQPTFDLQAPTGLTSLAVGFISVSDPWVGFKVLYPSPPETPGVIGEIEHGDDLAPDSFPEGAGPLSDGDGDDAPLPVLVYYIGTNVDLDTESNASLGFELDVIFQNLESSQVLLSISSTDAEALSIGSVAAALMNTTAQEIKSQAGPLASVLTSFTLEQFSAFVQPSLANPILSTRVVAGTSPAWPLPFPVGTDPALDLTIDWSMTFPPGTAPLWSITFSALLTFTQTLQFELSLLVDSSGDLDIIGAEIGTVTLSLAELIEAVAGVTPPIDLEASFTNFTVTLEVNAKIYSVSGTISASFALFGTPVLSIDDMAIAVIVNQSNPAQKFYTANLNGIIALGTVKALTSAVVTNQQDADTVFSMHLVDETLGSMLNHIVHLVDPTYDITFPSPWNAILDISLDAFQVDVNVTKKILTLTYSLDLDLVFITVSGVTLTYTASTATAASSVVIALQGTFLGQSFGGGNPPLAWDAVNENPPSIPGQGSQLFDLQYAGLGQHITFTDLASMTDVQTVMTNMRNSVLPSQAGALPPFGQNGLAFSQESGWLIGAEFTVMQTVSLSVVFNDPNLYGLLISLSGSKAGGFAGLSFEILYRKVSDSIGVYHIELTLPEAMRTFELGEVSLTLPSVILDIFTNGNFKVNFGFPVGLDFSNSFALQVFPFVGYGGFYFALLDGSTSSRVPQISNGTFSPVIEFGLALSIGVGKTVDEGILSGGITVTVVGIVQGVLAWFNPNSSSVPSDRYYWFQGTIAITGRLYATINFAIIQASVDVTAYASVTLTIEAYQPIFIAIEASVSVSVSVRIIFITIHLSFSASISASFTIGSASTPPWTLAPGSGANATISVRRLRGQRTLHRRRPLHSRMRRVLRREAAKRRVLAANLTTIWPIVAVFPGGPQTLTLYAFPAFTKSTAPNSVNGVMLLTAQSSADPDATTPSRQRTLFGSDPGTAAFNVLAEAMLRWGIWMQTEANGPVTADQLAELEARLRIPANALDAPTVSNFLGANFRTITIGPPPTTSTGAAIFPVFPELSLATSDGVNVNFNVANGVGTQYQANIPAYFQLLLTQFQANNGTGPGPGTAQLAADDTTVSMASIVFGQYFLMLMRGAVQSAIDYLAAFPYTTPSAQTLAQVAAATDPTLTSDPLRIIEPNLNAGAILNAGAVLALPNVLHQVRLGDSFAGVAATFAAAGAFNFSATPVALGADDVAAANLATGNLFNSGTSVPITGIGYTSQAGDTLALIAARLLIRAAGNAVLTNIANLQTAVTAFAAANASITDPAAVLEAGTPVAVPPAFTSVAAGPYITVAGDTLTLVAAYFAAVAQTSVAFQTLVNAIQSANGSVSGTGPNSVLTTGTALAIPPVTRVLAPGDTMNNLAVTLITTPAVIQSAMLAVPATTNLLSPQAVLSVPLQYQLNGSDTFAGIAAKFSLTLDDFAADVGNTTAVLFAAGAALTISDVGSVDTTALAASLLQQGEWNNLSGYVSRFFLSGLQLPDPNSTAFASATPQQLVSEPSILAGFPTVPLYAATAQQFPIDSQPPADYQITLSNTGGVPWLIFADGSTLPITLTPAQTALISTIASTPVQPAVANLSRLALFQMVPPRIALQQVVAWQAASLPASGCLAAGSQATSNPSLWLFPTSLIDQLQAGPVLRELVSATHSDPSQPVTAQQVGCYAWGTIVDVTITLPVTDGPSASVTNAYVVEGADDAGAEVLRQLYLYLTTGSDTATIYLLYSPSPTSTNPSGLSSDQLDSATTFLLKTNLSTITSSGTAGGEVTLVSDPTDTYTAVLSDADDFIALLWEASITRNGGFYLQYVNQNGGAALPGTVFGNQSSATLSVLVLLQSQLQSASALLQPFNNCAVVGTNIDPSSMNVFVQPVTALAGATDTLTTLAAAFNTNWNGTLQPADVATLNAAVQLLLQPGVSIANPAGGSYTIVYGDTFAAIATKLSTTVAALATAGSNATAAMFQAGAQVQFALGVLQPASTVPPGTTGFEMTRAIPDPTSDPVDTLFHLVGWNIAGEGGFAKSGEGLPTTPAESGQDGSNGLAPRSLDETPPSAWNYQQSLNVAPFATAMNGSASLALPPAQWNPYNGIGSGTAVTLQLEFQDVYGNEVQVPPWNTLTVPVGYFDPLVGFGSWPSLAIAYLVTAGASPAIELDLSLTMQQARYIPTAALPLSSTCRAVAADLIAYTTIYYQLAQPDVGLTLSTTLAPAAGAVPLALTPFAMFARAAYVYLAALNQLTQVMAPGGSLSSLTSTFQVTAGQLFTANGSQLYSTLFGGVLAVPQTYTSVQNDSLDSIVAQFSGSSVSALAQTNASVALDAGADLAAPARTTTAAATDSLSSVAQRMQASAAGIASANAAAPILAANVTFTVGTQSYTTAAGDDFTTVAAKVGATLMAVADANQFLTGIFTGSPALTIDDVVAGQGDSLQSLAAQFASSGFTVATLATSNETLGNLFAPGTSLVIGTRTAIVGPAADDTLSSFAASNGVSLDQLAAFNSGAAFSAGACLVIPGLVSGAGALQYSIYVAGSADTLGAIAGKFSGATADSIAKLNVDLPGLIAGAESIADSTSGKSVSTADGDTFAAIIARFGQQQGVTVSLEQLADDMAAAPNLLVPGALWITPPMLAANSGAQPTNSLAGFAAQFNLDPVAVATANAASQGFLAPQISFDAQFNIAGKPVSVPITTGSNATINSIVTMVAQAGFQVSVADVATAALTVENLLNPAAVAVPFVPPVAAAATVTPSFTGTIFPISVSLTTTRNTAWVDPDFAGVDGVFESTYAVTPVADANASGNLALVTFATDLQNAIPGIAVATGQADGTPGNEPVTIWGVNFSNSGNVSSTPVTVTFGGPSSVQFFALPPLSTTLLAGTFDVQQYTTGSGLQPGGSQTFQAVDLDVWLGTFLEAIDLVLSPAYAVPAFALTPAALQSIISSKADLALVIAQRVEYLLAGMSGGSLADAQAALYEAMLQQLSSAVTVNSLVQVPVTVASSFSGDLSPLLNGKITVPDVTQEEANAYSFSTAKVDLANGASTATFLFTVKSPASQPNVTLTLQYDTVQLEVPSAPPLIGDYQPSNWLHFILPQSSSPIGSVEIPIPLRAYPAPVTLVSQVAQQRVPTPAAVSDLLPWNFDFVYEHQDAPQDSATVSVTFPGSAGATTQSQRLPAARRLHLARIDDAEAAAVNVPGIFQNLAQFMAVWPALQADLGLLPVTPPGRPSTNAQVAVQTFGTLVSNVVSAWNQAGTQDSIAADGQAPIVYTWTLIKQGTSDADPTLTTLTIDAPPNPTQLFPDVYANGSTKPLPQSQPPTATQAIYQYPSGIPLDAILPQRFVFNAGTIAADARPTLRLLAPAPAPADAAPQTYQFNGLDIVELNSGLAGVSISRNASLLPNIATNPDFVYRTPLSTFPNPAVPSILATNAIAIGSGAETGIAAALQGVFSTLFASVPSGGTAGIRFACSYSYTLATAVSGGSPTAVTTMPALLPVLLVPSYAFNPATDEDPTNPSSFVSQVQSFIAAWQSANDPQQANGAYTFDLTVFSPNASSLQPLIHAMALVYSL